jgi:hypothetical protein
MNTAYAVESLGHTIGDVSKSVLDADAYNSEVQDIEVLGDTRVGFPSQM